MEGEGLGLYVLGFVPNWTFSFLKTTLDLILLNPNKFCRYMLP